MRVSPPTGLLRAWLVQRYGTKSQLSGLSSEFQTKFVMVIGRNHKPQVWENHEIGLHVPILSP